MLLLPVYPSTRPPVALAQSTSLTIYADGRLLVRRTLPVAVAAGESRMRVDLGVRDVDPGSFVALDSGVQIRGIRYAAGLGQEGALRRLIGREISFRLDEAGATRLLTGTLLSADPFAVRVDGLVMYSWPGVPVFPDSLVQLEPDVELTVEARQAAPSLSLLYQSGGISWSASYALMVPRAGAGRAAMTGTALITNGSALNLRGAQVQLLAGDVRRAAPLPRPMAGRALALDAVAVSQAGEASEEALGGTHLYTLPGTHDFVVGESRGLALFPRAIADVEREFVLQSQGYGFTQQWPDAMRDLHPEIAYRVRRPTAGAAASFAGTPLPAGVVRVYEMDGQGRPQLAGEASIPHTPAGRDLRLATGTAFDVTAQKVQSDFQQVSPREATSAYRVELQNAKAEAVTVLVTDACPRQCDVLSSTVPPERGTAQLVGFRVTVPGNGAATLEYRLRARW